MIDRETLESSIQEYMQKITRKNRKPSYEGLAYAIGISDMTVKHIVTGYYSENKPYTDKPQYNRCIDNDDFKIIQSIFI